MEDSFSTPNGSNSANNNQATDQSGEVPIAARNSSRKRKRSTNIGDTLPTGIKLVLRCNDDLQPNEDDEITIAFSTKAGVVVRRDIPICYTNWREVPDTYKKNAAKCLGDYFEYDYQESLDTEYTRKKLNNMWRSYKQELYRDHVKDKNPRIVRENPPSTYTQPLEEWKIFVDNCNTQEFKDASERNTKNRAKQTLPSCSGRRLASVVRHNIAQARGVPDSEVGRSEAYIALHTRKDKSLQCPELVDALNTYMTVNPESRATAVDDALMQTTHADTRGFRGMGTGVTKTQIRLGEPMRKKNARLREKNNELENTIHNMHTQFQQEMDELRSLIMRQGAASTSNITSPHSHASSHTAEVDTMIGKECNLRAGWPMRNVAKGIVQDVNPQNDLGGIHLGEDNCKVYVIAVMEPNILLPCPHDEYTMTLGQLGQGSVIWPKEALQFQLSGRHY